MEYHALALLLPVLASFFCPNAGIVVKPCTSDASCAESSPVTVGCINGTCTKCLGDGDCPLVPCNATEYICGARQLAAAADKNSSSAQGVCFKPIGGPLVLRPKVRVC